MRRVAVYSVLATMLGLAFVLVPMIAVAGVKRSNYHNARMFPYGEFIEAEAGYSDTPRFSTSDVEIFAVGFIVALVAYLYVRSKTPKQEYNWIGPFLY